MKTIKVLWAFIALSWLGVTGLDLLLSLGLVQSAVQASQLYDRAAVQVLAIITVTLLLKLGDGSSDKDVLEKIERHMDVLEKIERDMDVASESSRYICRVLYRQQWGAGKQSGGDLAV